MLRLALSTLSSRKAGAAGAFTAVGLATVLVVSCGILLQSSLDAPIPVERLAAAAIVVHANPATSGDGDVSLTLPERPRLAATLTTRLEPLPGVQAAIADRSIDIELADRHGRLAQGRGGAPTIAHGWASAALTPYLLASGHRPTLASEIVLDVDLAQRSGIEPGDPVEVVTASTRGTFTVAGTVAAPAKRPMGAMAVFVRDDIARQLAGTGDRADLIGILLNPGASPDSTVGAVHTTLGGSDVQILTGTRRGEAESPDAALDKEDIVAGLTVFALIAAFVAIFVVASTFALAVQQRHRELALLRAIGATPRQVRQLIAAEALVIAIAASSAATPVGILAAHLELGLFARAGMLPDELTIGVGWLPVAGGLAAAILTTQVAVIASAHRAARIRPADALREARASRQPLSRIRGLAGLAALAGGFGVLLLSGSGRSGSAPAAAMVWMLAAALLGPLLAWPFTRIIARPLATIGRGPGLLAYANVSTNLRRVASVATPIMLALSLVCTLVYGKAILERQTTDQTERRTLAGDILQPDGGPGLPADTADSLRLLPAVQAASASMSTTVLIAADGRNLRSFNARTVDPASIADVVDLGLTSGSLDELRGDTLAIGTDTAALLGRETGDDVHLLLGDGTPATLRVVATYDRPLGFGDVLLPGELIAGHVDHPFVDTVFVKRRPGADQATLAKGLHQLDPPLLAGALLTRSDYRHQIERATRKQSAPIYVLLALVVAFCVLALVNAVAMSTADRAPELAQLRLIGAERRQLRSMILTETLITMAFGLTIGTLITVPGLAVLNHDLTGSLIPSLPLWIYGALVAVFVSAGLAATILPTRRALRVDPSSVVGTPD